jgi:hypothetical protein
MSFASGRMPSINFGENLMSVDLAVFYTTTILCALGALMLPLAG